MHHIFVDASNIMIGAQYVPNADGNGTSLDAVRRRRRPAECGCLPSPACLTELGCCWCPCAAGITLKLRLSRRQPGSEASVGCPCVCAGPARQRPLPLAAGGGGPGRDLRQGRGGLVAQRGHVSGDTLDRQRAYPPCLASTSARRALHYPPSAAPGAPPPPLASFPGTRCGWRGGRRATTLPSSGASLTRRSRSWMPPCATASCRSRARPSRSRTPSCCSQVSLTMHARGWLRQQQEAAQSCHRGGSQPLLLP